MCDCEFGLILVGVNMMQIYDLILNQIEFDLIGDKFTHHFETCTMIVLNLFHAINTSIED